MPLVSIIVPAFNAQATLDETLQSARNQTLRDVEIIVVADGCTDGTVRLAKQHRQSDPRIRIIEQPNGGVASARNTGIAAASGEFIAPLDADDLWHPRKLERQIGRFEASDPKLGLVYCWYRPIDAASQVCGRVAAPLIEGAVLHRHLQWNFVGNGSAPLIRREALAGLRYDPTLRAANAGGCEDYLLQLQIALDWEFACVPEYLVGYRQTSGAMSSDRGAMLRSHALAFRKIRPVLPLSARKVCDRRIAQFEVLAASNGLRNGRIGPAAGALGRALRTDFGGAANAVAEQAATIYRSRTGREAVSPTLDEAFASLDPALPPTSWEPSAEMRRLAELDGAD